VLGAVDALTKEVMTVIKRTTVHADTVCQRLTQLVAHADGLPVPVVLDNVRYQKCTLVQQYAAALGVELLSLPAYAPHLNLIERLWRFVRKECLYSRYDATCDAFCAALEHGLASAHTDHRLERETLLSWNFQSFKNVQNLAV
jgi:transposase